MKKLIVVIFLISLTLCEEVREFDEKLKYKINKDEVNIQSVTLAVVGGFILKAAASYAIGLICEKIFDKIHYRVTQGYMRDSFLENGRAHWVSNIKDGYVFSLYWHKTKRHSATCVGGLLGGGQKRVIANAGEYAVAYCKAGVSGRKTFYNNLE